MSDGPAPSGLANRTKRAAILFVDDDERMRVFMRDVLSQNGYGITTSSDGQAALDLFRGNPERFQVVITDLSMPGISGLSFAEELRKVSPSIPIIFFTGMSLEGCERELRELGVRHALAKPVQPRRLLQAVQESLAGAA